MTSEREVYWLHVDSDGREQRSMVPPKGVRSLRVEILHEDKSEVVERTFTNDRFGKPVEPKSGLNQDRWSIDDHAHYDDGSTPWLRVRQATTTKSKTVEISNVK
jgi:hypothetical protein